MKARWVVSLSDGSSATEGRGEYKEKAGELSPWRKLLKYMKENDLYVTAIKIIVEGNQYLLPTKGRGYRFESEKPEHLYYRRKASQDIMTGEKEKYIGAIAEYKDFTIKLWINEKTKETYVQVIGQRDGESQ